MAYKRSLDLNAGKKYTIIKTNKTADKEEIKIGDTPYIHLHPAHIQHNLLSEDFDKASNSTSLDNALKNMLRDYARRINTTNTKIIDSDGKNLFKTLADRKTSAASVDALLRGVAVQLNKQFEKTPLGVNETLLEGRSAAIKAGQDMFAGLNQNISYLEALNKINAFLDDISRTINDVTGWAGGASPSEWTAFKKVFQSHILNKTPFSENEISYFNLNGMDYFHKILRYLSNIAKKYSIQQGSYDNKSLEGSMVAIFNGALSETGFADLIAKNIDALKRQMGQKISEATRGEVTGGNPNSSGKFQKPDHKEILGDGLMAIAVQINQTNYGIALEGEISFSDKMINGFGLADLSQKDSTPYTAITMERKGSLFNLMVEEGIREYSAANAIVFSRHEGGATYGYVRSFYRLLLRKYLIDYLAGQQGDSDIVLMICVNGYVYPVFSLLYRFLDYMKQHRKDYDKNGLFYITEHGKITNHKIGKNNNINLAIQRSREVYKQAKQFYIQIKLRGRELAILMAQDSQEGIKL